ncbi:MFS transporter [Agromyces bracchium]|uniref:MFS transporter n=1 Tax=Agromyces bracchium TaxID=88376 RepID=A0A6I3MAW2_9MICO|nr:MFS transporter [Agromyces bracchium]MTH69908.1 MFS transporter [Agromyces bracchium]
MSQTADAPARHHARWVVAALCTGTLLSALNSGMVAVALSTLRREFGVDVATVTWVISVFYLTSAVLQPVMGRLADRYGPRRVFAIGMWTVALAGALGPFAPNLVVLCAVRVLLAIGTATAFPSAAAMLRAVAATSGGNATKMIGRIQLVDTSSAAIGPVLGGLLIVAFGWPAIFWINIPLAALALVSTGILAPRDAPRTRVPLRRTLGEADLPGVTLFVVAVATLLVFLLELADDPPWFLLPVIAAAVALFGWHELRAATPFIDLRLLAANTPLVRVYALFILANLVFYGALFGIPQYLEDHAGYRTDLIGVLLLPLAAFNVVTAPLVERLIDRSGLQRTLVIGLGALTVGALALPLLGASTAAWAVLAATAAVGIPYVFVLVSITQSLYVAAPSEHVGQAAGLFQTARSLGCIGAAVVVGLSFSGGTDPADWLVLATATVGLAVATLVVALAWRPRRTISAQVHPNPPDPAK